MCNYYRVLVFLLKFFYILERYRVLCLFDYLKGLFVETAFAAVKMVVPDVLCYVVFLTVERDSVSRYTVAYSAYSRAQYVSLCS